MSVQRFTVSIEGRRIGYVEGALAKKLQPVLVSAVQNGWCSVAKKVPCSKTAIVYHLSSPADCFYKEFLSRSYMERIKAFFKVSRSRRYIKQTELLKANHFNSPEVLAAGELDGSEFVVSRAVPGVSFGSYLCALLRRPKDPEHLRWKRLLLSSVGELVGRLHAAGFIHGDLRPNNIVLEVNNGLPKWFLIDNERNQQCNSLSKEDIVKNLVQIMMFHSVDMTLTDRRRFFKAYFENYSPDVDCRELEREVLEKVSKRLKQKPIVKPDVDEVMAGAGDFPQAFKATEKASE